MTGSLDETGEAAPVTRTMENGTSMILESGIVEFGHSDDQTERAIKLVSAFDPSHSSDDGMSQK